MVGTEQPNSTPLSNILPTSRQTSLTTMDNISTPLPCTPLETHINDTPASDEQRDVTLQGSHVVNANSLPDFNDADFSIDCTLPSPNWIGNDNILPPNSTVLETPNLDSEHSHEAQALMGINDPKTTRRANLYTLKDLGTFCVETFRPDRMFLLKAGNVDKLLFETRVFLFPGDDGTCFPAGFDEWTEGQLKRLRHYLIEFVAKYKSRKTKQDISPSTLKTYILGIQRGFCWEWGCDLKLTSGPIFNDPKKGLFSVLDNKALEQQRLGHHVVSHNVLSREDVAKLYKSSSLSRDTPKGFLARVVFTIGIVTAMRPSALASLTTSQFKKSSIRGKNVWTIMAAVGSDIGASKTSRGGWSAIG